MFMRKYRAHSSASGTQPGTLVMPEVSITYTPVGVESPRVPDYWLYRCLRRFSGFLAHVLALGFTVFLIILARPGTSLFSWHPVFMAAAFCLCMTEAVLLLSPETSPLCPLSRHSKARLHWILQVCVPFLAGVGLLYIIRSKNRSEHSHFTSWHSILGVATLTATFCQALCGLVLLCPWLARGSAVSRIKLYHSTCGLLVYLLATFTILFGVCSDWFQAQIKGPAWYICFAIPFYPALVIMNQVLDIYLPKKKSQI